jgi:hypothetical protein
MAMKERSAAMDSGKGVGCHRPCWGGRLASEGGTRSPPPDQRKPAGPSALGAQAAQRRAGKQSMAARLSNTASGLSPGDGDAAQPATEHGRVLVRQSLTCAEPGREGRPPLPSGEGEGAGHRRRRSAAAGLVAAAGPTIRSSPGGLRPVNALTPGCRRPPPGPGRRTGGTVGACGGRSSPVRLALGLPRSSQA